MPLPAEYWQARGAFLASLHETRGPVVPALLGQAPVVFLLGLEANRIVLQSQRQSFSHRQGWDWFFGHSAEPPHLLTMDDPEHSWHRRLVHPAFAAHRLAGQRALIAQLVDRRLATWEARGIVDLYEEARVITLDVVAAVLLGLHNPADRALCRRIYLHGGHQRATEFVQLLHRLITERRTQPTGDALGLLAQARDSVGQPLDMDQICAHAEVMLIAGHETSASLAAWTFFLLLQHPEWERRLLHDSPDQQEHISTGRDSVGQQGYPTLARGTTGLSTLERVLREAERLYPPVQVAPRMVISAVEIGGYLLSAGTRIFYSAAATHLLPSLWSAPLVFDPDRFSRPREEHRQHPYALIGFGGGPRVCIGRSLARLELGIFVTHALRRYKLTLVPGQVITQRAGVTSRPARGVRVQVTRHRRAG